MKTALSHIDSRSLFRSEEALHQVGKNESWKSIFKLGPFVPLTSLIPRCREIDVDFGTCHLDVLEHEQYPEYRITSRMREGFVEKHYSPPGSEFSANPLRKMQQRKASTNALFYILITKCKSNIPLQPEREDNRGEKKPKEKKHPFIGSNRLIAGPVQRGQPQRPKQRAQIPEGRVTI